MQEEFDIDFANVELIENMFKAGVEKFPPLGKNACNLTKKERVEAHAKHWGVVYAYERCYKNLTRDPIDILQDALNDVDIEICFAKQQQNKYHYTKAHEAIVYLIEFMKKKGK